MGMIASFMRGWNRGKIDQLLRKLSPVEIEEVRQELELRLWDHSPNYGEQLLLEQLSTEACPSCGNPVLTTYTCDLSGCDIVFCSQCGVRSHPSAEKEFCSKEHYQLDLDAQHEKHVMQRESKRQTQICGNHWCGQPVDSPDDIQLCMECHGECCPQCAYIYSTTGSFCSYNCYMDYGD